MTRRWTLRLVAGLGAGVLVLAGGCSAEQPANETLPEVSADPSGEELPPLGPEDLPMPDEARTQDAAGAEAFVRYYIALINRTSDVMDAEPLREFSRGCEDCERIADAAENADAAGNDYEGGEITVRGFGDPLLREDTAEIPLRIDQAEFAVLDANGSPTTGGSPEVSDALGAISLAWDSDRKSWMMTGLTFQ